MYENYTKQSLPSRDYRELLGSSLCVFNSNNSFLIENILRYDRDKQTSWYKLIDNESGKLMKYISKIIEGDLGLKVADKFKKLVSKRNRIIHSFQITDQDGKQCLATKDREHKQFVISKEYLLDFIKENESFSNLMYKVREQFNS